MLLFAVTGDLPFAEKYIYSIIGTDEKFSSPWNNWITRGNHFVWMTKAMPVSFGLVVTLELQGHTMNTHMYFGILLKAYTGL